MRLGKSKYREANNHAEGPSREGQRLYLPPFAGLENQERCQSGRSGLSRKQKCPQGYRGFESLPLRQRGPRSGRSEGPFGWPSLLEAMQRVLLIKGRKAAVALKPPPPGWREHSERNPPPPGWRERSERNPPPSGMARAQRAQSSPSRMARAQRAQSSLSRMTRAQRAQSSPSADRREAQPESRRPRRSLLGKAVFIHLAWPVSRAGRAQPPPPGWRSSLSGWPREAGPESRRPRRSLLGKAVFIQLAWPVSRAGRSKPPPPGWRERSERNPPSPPTRPAQRR
jgi:hypothetical protein